MRNPFYLFSVFLCLVSISAIAGDTTTIPLNRRLFHDQIKAEQKRLDKADGKLDGFIKLSKAGVSKAFAQDLTAKEQAIVYATQTPASEAVFGAKSGTPAWKTKPSFFVVAKKDDAINPALERFMSKRIKAKTI